MSNSVIKGIELRSRAIDRNAALLKHEVKSFTLKINSAFQINIESVEEEFSDMKRRASIIRVQVNSIENEMQPIADIVLPSAWKAKARKKRIEMIKKALRRSIVNVLAADGKLKSIENKIATASRQKPFIKHYKFSVTR